MIQIDAQQLLDEKMSADELIGFLETAMLHPNINIFIDGHNKVIGFTACDANGDIVSSLSERGMKMQSNGLRPYVQDLKGEIIKQQTKTLEWKEKFKDTERTLYFTRLCSMLILGTLLCFGYHYYKQSTELNKLKQTIEKPFVIKYTDSITN